MPDRLSGATRLFPIIGDPIKYVESPGRLTSTFEERRYDGICVPLQVPAEDLDAVMAGLNISKKRGRDPGHHAAQVRGLCPLRDEL